MPSQIHRLIGPLFSLFVVLLGVTYPARSNFAHNVPSNPANEGSAPHSGETFSIFLPLVENKPAWITAVSNGGDHTCVLTRDGGIKCWGFNGFGQLGDGTLNDRHTPVAVSGLTSGVIAISAGMYHTCALLQSGGVKCWGENASGELGDGTEVHYRSTPVDVIGLASGVTAITGGGGHTCALMQGGAIKCWGDNEDGQLGDNTTEDRYTPANVVGLSSVMSAVSSGTGHTCALTQGGGARCWGYNYDGQLGVGSQSIFQLTPADVVGLSAGVMQIALGNNHTCALTRGGGAKCWGFNFFGQVGDGTTAEMRRAAADVVGLSSGVIEVSAGINHTCALTVSGVKCWGDNFFGQVGDGTTTIRRSPVDVIGLVP